MSKKYCEWCKEDDTHFSFVVIRHKRYHALCLQAMKTYGSVEQVVGSFVCRTNSFGLGGSIPLRPTILWKE